MRTIKIPEKIIPEHTINIYNFDELSETVKQELANKHSEEIYKYGYEWEDELYHSLKTACDIFGFNYEEDSYGNLWPTYLADGIDCETARKMTGKRAVAYIQNHFNFKINPYFYKYHDCVADWNKLTKIKIRYDEKRNKEFKALETYEEWKQYRKKNPELNILKIRFFEENGITEYLYPINVATKKMQDNLPTGYCEDYQIFNAYQEFITRMRKNPDNVSLEDFFSLLINCFKKARDVERDYEESYEYLKEKYEDTEFYEDGTIYETYEKKDGTNG